MTLSASVTHLRRSARKLARDAAIPLHEALDRIARSEGYQRWSHLMAENREASIAARIRPRLEPGTVGLLAAATQAVMQYTVGYSFARPYASGIFLCDRCSALGSAFAGKGD